VTEVVTAGIRVEGAPHVGLALSPVAAGESLPRDEPAIEESPGAPAIEDPHRSGPAPHPSPLTSPFHGRSWRTSGPLPEAGATEP
jgi:hypothetical protein